MDIYLTNFLITAVTGAGGLALGGGLAAMVHSPSDRMVSLWMLPSAYYNITKKKVLWK